MLGPIFIREWLTVPRRGRHYFTRSMYLFVLWALALTAWQAAFGWGRGNSLGDLAYFGTLLFQLLCFLQLTLVVFFSALFAASAITQEKDKRTFILLLITDLKNPEIVLGKMLGSLLNIGMLVASAIPVLVFTILLGGVAIEQVWLAFVVLVSTALAAGSLGCLLALWREKTFQTLALTVLTLVLYLCLVEGLAVLTAYDLGWREAVEQWQARLNPYRAMLAVVEPATEADLGGAMIYQFAAVMMLLAGLLNAFGIWKLRVWNPSGEPIQQREAPETDALAPGGRKLAVDVHAAPGRMRSVWLNPVLWREIRTRAYGRKVLLIKGAYLLIFGFICFWVYQNLPTASAADRLLPVWGLVPMVVLSLLLVNAQSVTSITTERDAKALDLLLVTDLTPKEFIFGKLGGILYNTKEVLLLPLFLAIAYSWWGFIDFETLLYLLGALLVLFAFATMVGLHVSLHTVSTRLAIGYSLGTIFFLFVGTLLCIYLILVTGRFESQWMSFILYLAIGIGGLMFVLAWRRPSTALIMASWLCPLGIFYAITSILIGNPRTYQSGDPLLPFLVVTSAFGFTIAAMLVPLLSEFDVAFGYSAPAEE